MKYNLILAAMLTGSSVVSIAQTERDLASHEHGAAELNIALEDSGVYLELDSPWVNLVGFEHAPSTPEQHAKHDDAIAKLLQPQQLFLFSGNQCIVDSSKIESSMEADEHADHDDDDRHADHDDDDKHADHDDDDKHADHDDDDKHADHDDDDKHADHDDDDKHADHDEHGESESHSSLSVVYVFSCPEVADLESIELSLLSVWPGIEHLEIQLIGPGGQALSEATPGNPIVNLRQVQ